jgi:hypothetical protein
MKVKDSTVSVDGLQAPMLHACAVVDDIYLEIARHEVTLTSAKDGKHSDESLHYRGLACDFRNRDVTQDEFILIHAQVKIKLPAPYQIVIEKTHMHIEYDLKG